MDAMILIEREWQCIQNLPIALTDMTFGGDALGRLPDGRAVFVPFGIAGETVRDSPYGGKSRLHPRANCRDHHAVPAAHSGPLSTFWRLRRAAATSTWLTPIN